MRSELTAPQGRIFPSRPRQARRAQRSKGRRSVRQAHNSGTTSDRGVEQIDQAYERATRSPITGSVPPGSGFAEPLHHRAIDLDENIKRGPLPKNLAGMTINKKRQGDDLSPYCLRELISRDGAIRGENRPKLTVLGQSFSAPADLDIRQSRCIDKGPRDNGEGAVLRLPWALSLRCGYLVRFDRHFQVNPARRI